MISPEWIIESIFHFPQRSWSKNSMKERFAISYIMSRRNSWLRVKINGIFPVQMNTGLKLLNNMSAAYVGNIEFISFVLVDQIFRDHFSVNREDVWSECCCGQSLIHLSLYHWFLFPLCQFQKQCRKTPTKVIGINPLSV